MPKAALSAKLWLKIVEICMLHEEIANCVVTPLTDCKRRLLERSPVVWGTTSSSSSIVDCFIASWRRLSQWHLIFGHWHIPAVSLQEIVGRDKIFDRVFVHILVAIYADLRFNLQAVQSQMKISTYIWTYVPYAFAYLLNIVKNIFNRQCYLFKSGI